MPPVVLPVVSSKTKIVSSVASGSPAPPAPSSGVSAVKGVAERPSAVPALSLSTNQIICETAISTVPVSVRPPASVRV